MNHGSVKHFSHRGQNSSVVNVLASSGVRTTIIIPTHNRLPTLNCALTSAQRQTYPNTEIIVIDDASTDGTPEWLQTHYPDVKLIQLKANRGAAAARNLGIQAAQGPFIAFLDSDDTWHPDYLATQLKAFQQSTIILSYTNYYSKLPNIAKPQPISQKPDYQNLTASFLLNCFIHSMSQVVVRTSALQQVGLLDPRLSVCHDKELYLRLLKVGGFAHIAHPLVTKHWLPNSLVTQNNCQEWLEDEQRFLNIFFEQPENAQYLKLRLLAEQNLHRRVRNSQTLFAQVLSTTSTKTASLQPNDQQALVQQQPRTIRPAPRYHLTHKLGLITCYFNPGGYSTKFLNYQQFKLRIQAVGLKLITVECAMGDQPFQLAPTADVIQVRSKSILWQKERLLNLALQKLPSNIPNVAWLDGDILFANPNWAIQTVEQLQHYPVVQLFSQAIRLLPGQTTYQGQAEDIQHSFASLYNQHPERMILAGAGGRSHGHTGYAWAARRDILNRHGLYDAAIIGSADLFMAYAFVGQLEHPCLVQQLDTHQPHNPRIHHLKAWAKPIYGEIQGNIGYVDGILLHLWHGSAQNRQYIRRHQLLAQHNFNPATDLTLDPQGLWAWNCDKPELKQQITDYFDQRQEEYHPKKTQLIG